MNNPLLCLRCHTEMARGFVVDLTEYGPRQQYWFPGEPEPSFWVGLKGLTKENRVPVTTLRCPSCGYLESYANRIDPDV